MELKVDKVFLNRLLLITGLFMVFALGFAVRGEMLQYDYIFEFDSYFRARVVEVMLETNGSLPGQDPGTFHPGDSIQGQDKLMEWIGFYAYKAIHGNEYDKAKWFELLKFLPAIFGALTAVALYFFISELAGKKAGFVAAVMAAVMPAFIYRTMAGWFEDHTLGFLWMVIGFYFLIKAFKLDKLNVKSSTFVLLSGVFFGLFAITWGAFIIVPVIIGVYFVMQTYFDAVKPHLLKIFEKKERKQLLALILGAGVLIGFMVPFWFTQDQFFWFKAFLAVAATAALGFLAWIFVKGLESPIEMAKRLKIHLIIIFASLTLSLIAGTLFFGLNFVPGLVDAFADRAVHAFAVNSCLEAGLEGEGTVFALTGEQSPGCVAWHNKYNAFIVFPFLAIFLIFYQAMTRKTSKGDFLLFAWILVTMYFAYRQLKATFYFGLPVAASVGYVSGYLLEKYNQGIPKTLVAGFVFLLLLTGVAAGTVFMPSNTPSIQPGDSLDQTINWVKENTPEDAKIMNWWGIGHILAFFSDRQVFTDNRQSPSALSIAGSFYLAQSEEEAMQVLNEYEPDYVLVSWNDLQGIKSIALYTHQVTSSSDPRIQKYSAVVLPCSVSSEQVSCGSAQIPYESYVGYPTDFTETPTHFVAGEYPRYFYRNSLEDAQEFGPLLIVAGPLDSTDARGTPRISSPDSGIPTNNSMLLRLLIEDESLQHFELAYKNSNYKLFKVTY